jgi:hypothetical protein
MCPPPKKQARMTLNTNNIDTEIMHYLSDARAIKLPMQGEDIIEFIRIAKREPLQSGPYPSVSMFEAFNRILSDLVVLLGVRILLRKEILQIGRLPYTEYNVALGIEDGNDINAFHKGPPSSKLCGEAFNVSRGYFQTKKSHARKKLMRNGDAYHRVILFNSDAVSDPSQYRKVADRALFYIPIDVAKEIEQFKGDSLN